MERNGTAFRGLGLHGLDWTGLERVAGWLDGMGTEERKEQDLGGHVEDK